MILEREAGVEISRATLDGWVMRVGELLQPIVNAMRSGLLTTTYLQADETNSAGADARQTRQRSSGVLMAVRQAGRLLLLGILSTRSGTRPIQPLNLIVELRNAEHNELIVIEAGITVMPGARLYTACLRAQAQILPKIEYSVGSRGTLSLSAWHPDLLLETLLYVFG
jgi:hypothetical protein